MSDTRHVMRLTAMVDGLVTALTTVRAFNPLASTVTATSNSNKVGRVTPRTLAIATYAAAPPPIVVNLGSHLAGIGGEFLTDFAKSDGLSIREYTTTCVSVILAGEEGKADLGAYHDYTAGRAKDDYYAFPWYNEATEAFALKSFHYDGVSSLANDKVDTVIGCVWASHLQEGLRGNVLLYQTPADVAQALLNGDTQRYVDSNTSGDAAPLAGKTRSVGHLVTKADRSMPDSIPRAHDYHFVNRHRPALARAVDKYETFLHKRGKWVAIRRDLTAAVRGGVPSLAAPLSCFVHPIKVTGPLGFLYSPLGAEILCCKRQGSRASAVGV